MSKFYLHFILLLFLIFAAGCTGKGSRIKNSKTAPEIAEVPDTGFTGIKQYKSGQKLVRETTFKNGVRQGLTKTYYVGGQLYQTFWYENGLKEDSARWYYPEGQLFRTTPFKHDTTDGIQKQFYRNGRLKAKIGYSKGMRIQFFQEFTPEGKLVGAYPEIVVSTQDEYKTKGIYRIILGLSGKGTKVKFYRGEFTSERFDTAKCIYIKPVGDKVILNLKKSGTSGRNNVGIIALISTLFGNNYLEYKKIDLPYDDLN